MLEILQFIFSSFWHWAGTVIILAVVIVAPVECVAKATAYSRKPLGTENK